MSKQAEINVFKRTELKKLLQDALGKILTYKKQIRKLREEKKALQEKYDDLLYRAAAHGE